MISEVKIFPVQNNKTVKANGTFVVNEAFKIKFALMNGSKGLFVGLPGEYYEDKTTKEKKWSSKVDCINDDVRKEMTAAVINAYNKATGSDLSQGSSPEPTDQTSPKKKNTIPF